MDFDFYFKQNFIYNFVNKKDKKLFKRYVNTDLNKFVNCDVDEFINLLYPSSDSSNKLYEKYYKNVFYQELGIYYILLNKHNDKHCINYNNKSIPVGEIGLAIYNQIENVYKRYNNKSKAVNQYTVDFIFENLKDYTHFIFTSHVEDPKRYIRHQLINNLDVIVINSYKSALCQEIYHKLSNKNNIVTNDYVYPLTFGELCRFRGLHMDLEFLYLNYSIKELEDLLSHPGMLEKEVEKYPEVKKLKENLNERITIELEKECEC